MTIATLITVSAAIGLAYVNGANDNFKGVATLYGSGLADYRRALTLATVAQVAGSLVSLLLATSLAKVFSGEGFVPPSMEGTAPLRLAVALAASATVFLATTGGMPTSTTHALVGALAGTALVTGPASNLWGKVMVPMAVALLLVPCVAIVSSATAYAVLRRLGHALGVSYDACACVEPSVDVWSARATGVATMSEAIGRTVRLGDGESCGLNADGTVRGVSVRSALGVAHILSGAAVCFSRGLNDTPKIAALLLTEPALNSRLAFGLVAAAMALGGMFQARRVAETMSRRITDLTASSGTCANIVTSALVIGASWAALPVSTTHVSNGAIFGIGIVRRRARWRVIGQIVLTWVATLPLAAWLGGAFATLFKAMRWL